MSHLRTKGVRRARRLPTVMQRKLAKCKGTNGRICFASQRSSLGILRLRKATCFADQHRRDTFRTEAYASPAGSVHTKRASFAFLSILVNFVGNKTCYLGGIASRPFGNSTYAATGAGGLTACERL